MAMSNAMMLFVILCALEIQIWAVFLLLIHHDRNT
jgi:hypothetical protein